MIRKRLQANRLNRALRRFTPASAPNELSLNAM